MKNATLLITAFLLGITLVAQPPKGPAKSGMTFGAPTTANDAIKADDLPAFLAGKDEAPVKIIGKVVEVCKAEGCWLKMQTSSGPMMIKMKDHAFMVPLAMNGKTIVVAGTAMLKETSVETLRHYAQDAGKTKDEIAAIVSPKKEIIVQAKGILVQ